MIIIFIFYYLCAHNIRDYKKKYLKKDIFENKTKLFE